MVLRPLVHVILDRAWKPTGESCAVTRGKTFRDYRATVPVYATKPADPPVAVLVLVHLRTFSSPHKSKRFLHDNELATLHYWVFDQLASLNEL